MPSDHTKKTPIPGGYAIRARCIANSKIAAAPPHIREIWELITREANHQDATYRGFSIKEGQLFRSYKDIRESLHWRVGWRKEYYCENQVKKAMKYLRDNGMIETKKAPGGVLITICNYAFYQDPKNYKRTKESTYESTYEEPMKNHYGTTNNNNVNNDKNLKKKKYLSEIKDSDHLDEYLKIAFNFWKVISNNLQELNIKLDSLNESTCESWTMPIRQLMIKHNKTKDEIDEVYQFFPTNTFWKKTLHHTNQLIKKNENGVLFFDSILIQKRESDAERNLPTIEELEFALNLRFNKPTKHFINLFYEYQIMCKESNLKILKGKTLELEIGKLANQSNYENMAAVNLLRKAISKKKEIPEGHNKKYYPSNL